MGRWSRDEIDGAFQRHSQVVVEIGKDWDWSRFADEFTEDATYVEHAFGTLRGRDQIREWIVSTMNSFPGWKCRISPPPGIPSTPTGAGCSANTSTG